jgi:hypothetical protein
MAMVQEYDANFRYTARTWLDFPLDRPNKGLQGLTCVRRDGQAHLLGMCSGNRCAAGAKGRIPGGGASASSESRGTRRGNGPPSRHAISSWTLWGSKTRPPVLTWTSMRLSRIR